MHTVAKRFIFLVLLCLPSPSFAQDARLIEAAKKEGKLILYGTMQSDIFELLQKAFYKKSGITIDYWRREAKRIPETFPALR